MRPGLNMTDGGSGWYDKNCPEYQLSTLEETS